MVTLAAQIAPQRSTLYSSLASQLAIPELLLSPLGPAIAGAEKKELGSQDYILLQLDRDLTDKDLFTLSMLAMTNEFFAYYERIGQTVGPFLRGYLREMDIPFEHREERLRQVGRRYTFRIGQGEEARQCVLAHADTAMTPAILAGQKVHLIVADLPYGVQHKGQISSLLAQALPGWQEVLRPRGGWPWPGTPPSWTVGR